MYVCMYVGRQRRREGGKEGETEVNVWMDGWTEEKKERRLYVRMYVCMCVCVYVGTICCLMHSYTLGKMSTLNGYPICMYVWMDAYMYVWMDGWKKSRKEERMYVCMHVCNVMYVCM